MGNLNGPYYPHTLIHGVAYAHITLFAYAHITVFDIPSLMHLEQTIWLSTCTFIGKQ